MSHELAARLEAEAVKWEKTQREHVGMAEHCGLYGNHGSAISWVATANNARQHAADLRAAAQAVRAMGPISIESDEPSKSDEVTVLKKLLKESTQKLKRCQERLAHVTVDLDATTDRAVGYLKKIQERES